MKKIRETLLEMLMAEHSLSQMNAIVDFVGNDQRRFDELVKIFLTDEYRIIQRASWPLSNSAEHHPQLVQKHLKKLIRFVKDEHQHQAVKRNILRIFDLVLIPEQLHGEIMNHCIDNIVNPSEPAAVQAYSLGILQKLTKIYPEINHEVKTIIESRMPDAGAAFASRAKKYLKAISGM